MTTVSEVRDATVRAYFSDRVDGTLGATVELLGVSFLADEPSMFGRVNKDYVARELEWYESCSLDVRDIPGGTPRIWEQVAADDHTILSNYGYLVFSPQNGYQYSRVAQELHDSPDSRRGTMVYTRPSVHVEAVADGRSDFICTNAVNYRRRSGKLSATVQMRSGDQVFGYRNDYAWQRWLLEKLASDLGDEPGDIYWQVASFHVYARHYNLLDHYAATGEWDVPLSAGRVV